MPVFKIPTYAHWPQWIPFTGGSGGGVQENGLVTFTRGGATQQTVTFVNGPYAPGYRWTVSAATPDSSSGTAPSCWVTNRTSTTMDVAIAGTTDLIVSWSVELPIP